MSCTRRDIHKFSIRDLTLVVLRRVSRRKSERTSQRRIEQQNTYAETDIFVSRTRVNANFTFEDRNGFFHLCRNISAFC